MRMFRDCLDLALVWITAVVVWALFIQVVV